MRQITFRLSNKMFYTLILIGILIVSSWIVFAYGGNNPPVMGHSLGEIDPCGDGQILKTSGGSWACVDESYSCTASGSTISCPDGTSLTDTNTDTNTWRPAITCDWSGWKNAYPEKSCGTCISFTSTIRIQCSGGVVVSTGAASVCSGCWSGP